MSVVADKGRTLPYLRAWRLHKSLSQEMVVERSGLSRSTVMRAEAGDEIVLFANVHKLAAALEMTVEQLVNTPPPGAEK